MTSIRKLKLIANAGEPDDVLAVRIDVVHAAMKVFEKFAASKLDNPLVGMPVTQAMTDMVRTCRKYKLAVTRRARSASAVQEK